MNYCYYIITLNIYVNTIYKIPTIYSKNIIIILWLLAAVWIRFVCIYKPQTHLILSLS